MAKVINIHKKGEQVDLKQGKYKIDILGGWGINLVDFLISFRNMETHELISCKKTFWHVQSFALNKRAKRMFIVWISKPGRYVVEFKSPESLKVKSSNLFISTYFERLIPNKTIDVYIY